MRFKKLRLAVGISLVVFILIAGNVIVFGLLQNKNNSAKISNDQLVNGIEKSKKLVVLEGRTYKIDDDEDYPNKNSQSNQATQQNQAITNNQQNSNTVVSPPVVTHRTVTRAS